MKSLHLLAGVFLVVAMLVFSSGPAMAQRAVSASDHGYAGQVVVVRIGAGTTSGYQINLFVSDNGLANNVDSTILENGRVFSIDPRFDSELAVTLPADLETGYYYIKVHDGSSFYLSNRIWIVNLYN
ncbi:MAG: hypothetical protein O6762_04370 [Thaumarchaeota archaeon]|nr:hypothetical protein [Nitrososphaerota archaeon]